MGHEISVRAGVANENFGRKRASAQARAISQERTSSAFSHITTDCSLVGSVRIAAVFH
jgi:hypothetical protein